MRTTVESDGHVFVDHYAALGVTLDATHRVIQQSFRRLAKILHPDVAGGDGLKFLELYTAYRVLGDNASRNRYNVQYVGHQKRRTGVSQVEPAAAPSVVQATAPAPFGADGHLIVPVGRLVFPGNVAVLARRGLLRRKFRRLHRRWMWNINYDVEVPLEEREFAVPILVSIPVVARTLCPDCRGSNLHCPACNGRGSYKNTRTLRIRLDGGLAYGQIIEIPLDRLRLESLSYFKKKRLRIRIGRAS